MKKIMFIALIAFSVVLFGITYTLRKNITSFRNSFGNNKESTISSQQGSQDQAVPSTAQTPTTTNGKSDTGGIRLTLTSPRTNTSVSATSVVIRGTTTPKAEVFANDAETVADNQGNFSLSVTLDEGENDIIVSANDEFGNSIEKELLITSNSGI